MMSGKAKLLSRPKVPQVWGTWQVYNILTLLTAHIDVCLFPYNHLFKLDHVAFPLLFFLGHLHDSTALSPGNGYRL